MFHHTTKFVLTVVLIVRKLHLIGNLREIKGMNIQHNKEVFHMDWVQLVSNYGFPIVVSLFLLTKTQQKLEEVSTLLARIDEALDNR